VDGIFCAAGDVCALGLLAATAKASVRVPQELAIIGYDDLPLAAESKPPLTTVRQPIRRMAEAAHRLAVVERALPSDAATRVVFAPELILRSTA
jgi:LacI family xylobiose transport system transcriptional regulator